MQSQKIIYNNKKIKNKLMKNKNHKKELKNQDREVKILIHNLHIN